MKHDFTAFKLKPRTPLLLCAAFCIAALQTASAWPPSPSQVLKRVKSKIGGVVNRVEKAVENDGSSGTRRRSVPNTERYYEPKSAPDESQTVILPDGQLTAVDGEGKHRLTGKARPDTGPDGKLLPKDLSDETGTVTQPRDEFERQAGASTAESSSPAAPQSPTVKIEGGPQIPQEVTQPGPRGVASRDALADFSTERKSDPIKEVRAEFATPVPAKAGYVYPPGVTQASANMLDVRGMNPGQKARDPRTGKVFLVP